MDNSTMSDLCTSSSVMIIEIGNSNAMSPTLKSSIAIAPLPAPSMSTFNKQRLEFHEFAWPYNTLFLKEAYEYNNLGKQNYIKMVKSSRMRTY